MFIFDSPPPPRNMIIFLLLTLGTEWFCRRTLLKVHVYVIMYGTFMLNRQHISRVTTDACVQLIAKTDVQIGRKNAQAVYTCI